MSKSILMTGALAALLSLAWASESTADTTSTVALRSPDGKLSVRVGLMSEGRLSYTVADGLEALLAPSPLGLVVDGVDLGAGAKFAGEPAVSEINETYPAFYNHAVAANHAKEAVIPLETAGKKFNLIVRVYDDGVAVRYSLPDGAQGVDGDSTTWVLPANTGKIAWQEHSQC